jgi:hypothetical protein
MAVEISLTECHYRGVVQIVVVRLNRVFFAIPGRHFCPGVISAGHGKVCLSWTGHLELQDQHFGAIVERLKCFSKALAYCDHVSVPKDT